MSHFTDPWENLPSRVKPSSTFGSEQEASGSGGTVWASGFWASGFWADGFWQSVVSGTQITNSNAEADAGNRYNICMRTGFRVKPGELIEDAYGSLVRQDSFDKRHPQEFIRPLAEELTGPKRPEPTDQFLSSSVSPEDL